MTFDLSPQHNAVRERARAYAQRLEPHAVQIDRAGEIDANLAREAKECLDGDQLAAVLAAEAIASVSPAVATLAVASPSAQPLRLAGLRGAKQPEPSAQTHVMLAAIALGAGQAATDAALAHLRRTNALPGADVEKPHWVVADVATELDAARLMTYKAARTSSDADIALARLLATSAAMRAVDAAVRVLGPEALAEGHPVERLARDVRALSVLMGTEEEYRAMAAEGLLPR